MREARELAIEALYEADQMGWTSLPDSEPTGKARKLAEGVLSKRDELDESIERASDHWRIDRMPVIDRAILRLGLYELRYLPEVPTPVILSEAVRIAKEFSTERSGTFVNGVLAALAASERFASGEL